MVNKQGAFRFFELITSEPVPIHIDDLFKNIDHTLLERFETYHEKNPHIYSYFEKLSRDMFDAGRRRYSAWAVMNRIRWEHDVQTEGDTFKISNDYIALYARLFIQKNPTMKDFFQIKKMKRQGRVFFDEKTPGYEVRL